MTEKRLEGRVALVSGGASGIGRATVLGLAREGAGVAVVDRDESGAREVAAAVQDAGGKASAFALELTDTGAIAPLVQHVVEDFGRIDLLVNAAGIYGERATILDVDVDDWDRVHAVNLKAPMLLMQAAARHMVERGGGGRIVNVSSSSAFRGAASPAPYGTSKAGLVQLTRSAAAELGPHDINVNAVAPGLTRTPLTAVVGDEQAHQEAVESGPLANLLQRVSTPEDVAEAIVFLCLPASRQITAQTLHTSAGSVL